MEDSNVQVASEQPDLGQTPSPKKLPQRGRHPMAWSPEDSLLNSSSTVNIDHIGVAEISRALESFKGALICDDALS